MSKRVAINGFRRIGRLALGRSMLRPPTRAVLRNQAVERSAGGGRWSVVQPSQLPAKAKPAVLTSAKKLRVCC